MPLRLNKQQLEEWTRRIHGLEEKEMGSMVTKAFEEALRSNGSMARVQLEKSILLWAKRVFAALGEIPELGPFSIESTHEPYQFRVYTNKSKGVIHLSATDPMEKDYSSARICELALPAWMIREVPVESLLSKEELMAGTMEEEARGSRVSPSWSIDGA